MKQFKVAVLFLAVLGLLACAKPPQADIDAAKAALDAAKAAEADIYAPDALRAAEDSINAIQTEVDAQAAKFALFRSYEKTKELVAAAKAAADKTTADANTMKEQVKNEALAIFGEAKTELTAAQELLAKAPKGKGSKADIEALKGDLDAIQPMLDGAQASFDAGKFMDAKNGAQAAKDKAIYVKDAINNAIEMAKGKKK
jgi:membrane-associated HD superfamily phosphohydrolase